MVAFQIYILKKICTYEGEGYLKRLHSKKICTYEGEGEEYPIVQILPITHFDCTEEKRTKPVKTRENKRRANSTNFLAWGVFHSRNLFVQSTMFAEFWYLKFSNASLTCTTTFQMDYFTVIATLSINNREITLVGGIQFHIQVNIMLELGNSYI